MDFNTRLKEEIEFADIRYKELAEKSGVPERALYNYVATKNPSMPPADVAVKIADALGVSVEYLVKGVEITEENLKPVLNAEYRMLGEQYDKLSEFNRQTVQDLTQSLLKRQ